MTKADHYRAVLLLVQKTARECGYAIGAHGSQVRDLDLIAVPWVDDALPADVLMRAVLEAVHGFLKQRRDGRKRDAPTLKPHGRLCWSIHLSKTDPDDYVDLSVMPTIDVWADRLHPQPLIPHKTSAL